MVWYCQHGEASENRLKELKLGLSMGRMQCGQFQASAAFFQIDALAYDLFKGFTREALEPSCHHHQGQTLRWQLCQTAGKVVHHAGSLHLKVSQKALDWFVAIRQRCWTSANDGLP